MLNATPGDRVSYTVMYGTKDGTTYMTEYGRVTATWPEGAPVMARIAVEDIRPHRARYVTRKLRDLAAAPAPEAAQDAPAETEQARQYRELASTITYQAQAIADGTITGPRRAAVSLLLSNTQMLLAWTPDDRSGMPAAAQQGGG